MNLKIFIVYIHISYIIWKTENKWSMFEPTSSLFSTTTHFIYKRKKIYTFTHTHCVYKTPCVCLCVCVRIQSIAEQHVVKANYIGWKIICLKLLCKKKIDASFENIFFFCGRAHISWPKWFLITCRSFFLTRTQHKWFCGSLAVLDHIL